MKIEYYSPQVKEHFEKLLFHRNEILQELDTYLKDTTKLLRTYHIWNNDTHFNQDKYGSRIFKEAKEEFWHWQTDRNSNIKCKHLFLALNATNSLRPNHYMRKKNGLIYFWEDCVDLNNFFKIANDITYTPLRYGFSFTFLKPNATLHINPLRKNQQPYIFTRAFLLTDGHMTFKSHNDIKTINSDNRDLVFYNSVKISLTNNTDKMQILLGTSYMMFDYDIKNYFYRFNGYGYQSPKLINFFPFY